MKRKGVKFTIYNSNIAPKNVGYLGVLQIIQRVSNETNLVASNRKHIFSCLFHQNNCDNINQFSDTAISNVRGGLSAIFMLEGLNVL